LQRVTGASMPDLARLSGDYRPANSLLPLLIPVVLNMQLRGFRGVVACVLMMPSSSVCVMGRLFVLARLMVMRRFFVMSCGVFMMFSSLSMMFCSFF
jgi:hypothetical protein